MLKVALLVLLAGQMSLGQWDKWESGGSSAKFSKIELNLMKSLIETQPDSTVTFSPFSIRALLAMVKEGSSKNTEKVLNENLGETRGLMNTLSYSPRSGITYGNAVFLNNNYDVNESFKEAVTDKFRAIFKYEDFNHATKAAYNINDFVKFQTRKQIKKIVDPSSLSKDTVLMMVNAIHLAAKWKMPFDKDETKDGVFWEQEANGLEVKLAPVMHSSNRYRMGRVPNLNARVLELPFEVPERHALYVLLPNEANGLKAMIKKMTPESLSETFNALSNPSEVYVYMPRFEVALTKNLKDILPGELGSILGGAGNVEGIVTQGNVQLNNILHKAILKVDEGGSTSIEAINLSIHVTLTFNASYPFAYFVTQIPPEGLEQFWSPPSEIYFMGFTGKLNEAKAVPSTWGPMFDPDVSAPINPPPTRRPKPIRPIQAQLYFNYGESFAGCGTVTSHHRRRRTATPLITKGVDASHYEHPWHVTFVDSRDIFFCGGTLVSTTAVLTAAHCFVFRDNTRMHPSVFGVVLGAVDWDKIIKSGRVNGRQTPKAVQVIVHPDYAKPKFDHDVAIILLEQPGVIITHLVRPICLWKDDYDFSKIHNKSGKVTGWGLTEEITVPEVLQVAELRVIPYQECFSTDPNFFRQFLKPRSNFCAGEKGINTCLGDSGGGFAFPEDEKWYLRGVVSLGQTVTVNKDGKDVKMCMGIIPSLFTDITFYMDWIVQNANLTHRLRN